MSLALRIDAIKQRGIVLLLAATIVTPLLFSSSLHDWRIFRPVVCELLALSLAAVALMSASIPRTGDSLRRFLRSGPHLPVALLVLYGAVSAGCSPFPRFSGTEWIRLASGAALYFVTATALRPRSQVKGTVSLLMVVASLTALGGLIRYRMTGENSLSAFFMNPQLCSGFLMIQTPLVLVLAFAGSSARERLVSQATAIILVPALLLTQTRSSWLGLLVSMVLLATVMLCQAESRRQLLRHCHRLVPPIAILLGSVGVFLAASHTSAPLAVRARTLAAPSRDPSFAWRLQKWNEAWELFRERPLLGWGIGTFPLKQFRKSADAPLPRLVRSAGPTLAQEAHNEYAQIAAEMGIVGLGLYLWLFGAFFVFGYRAARGRRSGLRQSVLIGCLAGVAAQLIDALSNPAWRFADVSFMLWLILGLGMAAAQGSPPSQPGGSEPTRDGTRGPLLRLGWQGASLALALVSMGATWAQRGYGPVPLYTEAVQLSIQPSNITLQPGQCVNFHVFEDTPGASPTELTDRPETRLFTRMGVDQCLMGQADSGKANVFCVPQDACSAPGCGGDRTVLVFATYGHPQVTTTARVRISCPIVHDVAISRLQVPLLVYRNLDAPVQVTVANRGTQTEQCQLRLRVQPGLVVVADAEVTLAAGETRTLTLTWPTTLMGDDGPKTLIAELILEGSEDSHPADNQANQLVTVGP